MDTLGWVGKGKSRLLEDKHKSKILNLHNCCVSCSLDNSKFVFKFVLCFTVVILYGSYRTVQVNVQNKNVENYISVSLKEYDAIKYSLSPWVPMYVSLKTKYKNICFHCTILSIFCKLWPRKVPSSKKLSKRLEKV